MCAAPLESQSALLLEAENLLERYGCTGYKRSPKSIVGVPAFAWFAIMPEASPRRGVVLFIDPCRTHVCPLHRISPKSHPRILARAKTTQRRDTVLNKILVKRGFVVVRVWGCTVMRDPARFVQKVRHALSKEPKPMLMRVHPSYRKVRAWSWR